MINLSGKFIRIFCVALASSLTVPLLASKLGMFSSHQNIGDAKKGKAKYNSKRDTYAITGSGANIWGKTDAFQYVYEQVNGDVSLTVGIEWEGTGKEGHRKAGIMLRSALTPDSSYVDVMVHGDGLTSLQYRENAGDDTHETRSGVKAPKLIRLERHGDQFTLSAGEDLDDLKTTGPVTVKLAETGYVGFAVSSHNASVSETAIFKSPKIVTAPAKAKLDLPVLARF